MVYDREERKGSYDWRYLYCVVQGVSLVLLDRKLVVESSFQLPGKLHN